MAGKPHSRSRRVEILARAELVGIEQAAAEANTPPATLKRWARELGKAALQETPEQPPAPPVPQPEDFGSRSAYLQARADHARAAQLLAERREDQLLAAGRVMDARAAAELSDRRARRAADWEGQAAEAIDAEHRLATGDAEILLVVLRGVAAAVDVPFRVLQPVVRELLAGPAAGEEPKASPELLAEAQEAVLTTFRERLAPEIREKARAELLEELAEREQAQHQSEGADELRRSGLRSAS